MVWRNFTWLLNPHLNRELNMSITATKYDRKIEATHCLRVNIKSLAAEAKIIRREERRAGPSYRICLSAHRKGRLREESRVAQLALAFLRGRPYREVEFKAAATPKPSAISNKLKKYFNYDGVDADVIKWLK